MTLFDYNSVDECLLFVYFLISATVKLPDALSRIIDFF